MAQTISFPSGDDLATKIARALGFEPSVVARIIIDCNAEIPTPVLIYVKLIGTNELLEVDWDALLAGGQSVVAVESELRRAERARDNAISDASDATVRAEMNEKILQDNGLPYAAD